MAQIIAESTISGMQVFYLPVHKGPVTAKVNGSSAAIIYQDQDNLVLQDATQLGDIVEIFYTGKGYFLEPKDLPSGGPTGASLVKVSDVDYDYQWQTAEASYTLPVASTTTLGGIKKGLGLTIDASGFLSTDVTSVNGQTGAVTITYTDVGAEPADSTILKSASIGVSVQPYSANTVVDAGYVHTDNNYTSAEKSKLSGIAAGAEVNVNADWNAISGDAQILNKPTLFSGAYTDLTGKPTLFSGAYSDLTGKPLLFSGAYSDLTGKPTLFDPANPVDIGTATHANATFSNATVTGNLTVSGSITTVNTANLDVSDNLIYMANANSTDAVDIGFAGAYNNGTHYHTGLVRDASDGKWKLFSGITAEPGTTVDFSSATYDTLKIGSIETSGTQVTNWNAAYGWGNHASAGYLTTTLAASTYQPIGTYLTSSSIGSTVQAYDADLTSWAGITPSTKQDTLVSGTSIKTINGTSLLGSGDLAISGGGGSFTGGTLTSPLVLAAGTSTNGTEPLKLQSGVVTTVPAAGAVEYDGVTVFAAPSAGNRGVVPAVHYITQTSAYTTPTGTTALKQLFNATTNGALTVAGTTTYFFECDFDLTAISATSGTFSFGLLGTATYTRVKYWATAKKAAASQGSALLTIGTSATATALVAANTTTTGQATIRGKIVVGTGGTIIPAVAFSVASPAVVGVDSYFKIWAAGSNTEVEIGAWA